MTKMSAAHGFAGYHRLLCVLHWRILLHSVQAMDPGSYKCHNHYRLRSSPDFHVFPKLHHSPGGLIGFDVSDGAFTEPCHQSFQYSQASCLFVLVDMSRLLFTTSFKWQIIELQHFNNKGQLTRPECARLQPMMHSREASSGFHWTCCSVTRHCRATSVMFVRCQRAYIEAVCYGVLADGAAMILLSMLSSAQSFGMLLQEPCKQIYPPTSDVDHKLLTPQASHVPSKANFLRDAFMMGPSNGAAFMHASLFLTALLLLRGVLLILQALLASPLQFLRLFQLFLYWLLTVLAGTERAKRRIWSEQSLLYGPYVSLFTGLTFSCNRASCKNLQLLHPCHLTHLSLVMSSWM